MRNGIRIALFVFALRLLYAALAAVLDAGPLVDQGFRSDAGWYAQIATEGYPEVNDPDQLGYVRGPEVRQSPWAFFPLYPLVVHVVMELIGVEAAQAMFLLSWLLGIAALVLYHRFAVEWSDADTARWATLALGLFPAGIYFHVYYTEALFIALMMAAFLAVQRGAWAWAAATAALLVLVRPNGMVLLLPLALFAWERKGPAWKELLHLPPRAARSVLFLLPAVVAFVTFTIYQWHHTGTPFAFAAAQAGWGRSLTWPFHAFFRSGDVATQVESVYTIGLIGCAALLTRRLPTSFAVLVWMGILLPLTSGSVDSMLRFTLGFFPLFLPAGAWLARSRWRWPVLASYTLLQLSCWVLWLQGHPITQ